MQQQQQHPLPIISICPELFLVCSFISTGIIDCTNYTYYTRLDVLESYTPDTVTMIINDFKDNFVTFPIIRFSFLNENS